MLFVGEQERNGGTVSVRRRGEGDLGSVDTAALAERIAEEIREKR